jgi:hypothetical protein
MLPRPPWVDRLLVALFALLMAWVGFDMYQSHSGWIPGHVLPVTFGITPLVVVWGLGLPLEALLLLGVWAMAVLLLYSGIVDGVTGFPGKNSTLSISKGTEPYVFWVLICLNAVLVVVGAYFGIRWLVNRYAR